MDRTVTPDMLDGGSYSFYWCPECERAWRDIDLTPEDPLGIRESCPTCGLPRKYLEEITGDEYERLERTRELKELQFKAMGWTRCPGCGKWVKGKDAHLEGCRDPAGNYMVYMCIR